MDKAAITISLVCLLALVLGFGAAQGFLEAVKDWQHEQEYAIDRWRGDAQVLDMQMGILCRQYPQNPVCLWYTEDFKTRG